MMNANWIQRTEFAANRLDACEIQVKHTGVYTVVFIPCYGIKHENTLANI